MAVISLVVVPDTDDDRFAQVWVDGSIAGRPYRFILDTGTPITRVVADELTSRLRVLERRPSRGVFAAGSDDVVELPDVTLGPLQIIRHRAARCPKSGGVENLLGMDVLGRYACSFDFRESRLDVRRTGELPTTSDLYLDPAGHSYVEVRLGGVRADAVWDSGAGATIVDTGFLDRHRDLFQLTAPSLGTDATGMKLETETYVMDEVWIGGIVFDPRVVVAIDLTAANATLDRPMDMILGWPTWSQADWVFDYPARRWAVRR